MQLSAESNLTTKNTAVRVAVSLKRNSRFKLSSTPNLLCFVPNINVRFKVELLNQQKKNLYDVPKKLLCL